MVTAVVVGWRGRLATEAGIKAIFSNSRTDLKFFTLIFSGLLCALRVEKHMQPEDSCFTMGVCDVS